MQQTINVYTFNDLPESVQNEIIKRNHDVMFHDQWWDGCIDRITETAKECGFIDPDFKFQAFYCQGDGACIMADFRIDRIKNAGILLEYISQDDLAFLKLFNNLDATLKNDCGRYCHNSHAQLELNEFEDHFINELTYNGIVDRWVNVNIYHRLDDIIVTIAQGICSDLMNMLYSEIDHLSDDKTIADWLSDCDHILYTIEGVEV